MVITFLDVLALALIFIHFGIPLLYYRYSKTTWLPRPWNINIDPTYLPMITVIVPTYNEVKLIKRKLDNIYTQDYPRNRLKVIVVDSASTDGTLNEVRQWASTHRDINLKLVQEPERRGKAYALNIALKYASGEIIVITDADSWWQDKDTLTNAIKWLADSRVGAVSCIKNPTTSVMGEIEEGYRQYYNIQRISESKMYSTPIFHGELAAFRKELLERLGGFPVDLGADDSHTAHRIAMLGYRAIIPEDVMCVEVVPTKGYLLWRIRRAQHLVQHFTKALWDVLKNKVDRKYRAIVLTEAYLHLANPWILLVAIILLLATIVIGNFIAMLLLVIGLALLVLKTYRVWVITQFLLMLAIIRNLWTKEIVWEKQTKIAK